MSNASPGLRPAVVEVESGQPGRNARPWLAAVAAICAVLFVIDALGVSSARYARLDLGVELFVQQLPWGPLLYVFAAINWLAGLYQVIFGVAVALAFFIWDRRAGWLLFVGSGASLIDDLFKAAFARPRPAADLVHVIVFANGFSFPSGHAVFFTWLAVLVAAALAPRIHPRTRPLLWLAALAVVALVCLGRVYDGVHWPSDVLGGMLLGLGWASFVLWLPERWLPTPSRTWWRSRWPTRRVAGG